jgi:hypothetical protein
VKKRVRYETVWRVRWAAGDADFKDEFYAEKKAEIMRREGASCEVDCFKRAIMPTQNSLMKQIGSVARRKGLGRAITPEDLDRESQRKATSKSL